LNPTETKSWAKLAAHASATSRKPLSELVTGEHALGSFEVGGCYFDFSKQNIDATTRTHLLSLAEEMTVEAERDRMLRGDSINLSENRAVLHTALREGADAGIDISKDIEDTHKRMFEISERIRSGVWRGYTGKPITDVVHIGIGGSHLGPELVVNAMSKQARTGPRIHFVANIDGNELFPILAGLNPETSFFIVASKSFTTLETQVNAQSARAWFLERTCSVSAIAQHFLAVTTNIEAAAQFGLPEQNLLPMRDWVGGRFSLWSTVGLPIAIALGADCFRHLLAGARTVDEHFIQTPLATNVPVLTALSAIWNYNFLGAGSLAILCYDERLRLLPAYLQQLEMESNGKGVTRDGSPVSIHTSGIVWGGTGTRGQHAYHQLLHQGTRAFTADFILIAKDDYDKPEHHQWLAANALAQSQAMAIGFEAEAEPHRNLPGNRPTTTIVMEQLGPFELGALLAVYEHKVFCQGIIWNINSFDQWGVEVGKRLAYPIYETLTQGIDHDQDTATAALIRHLRKTP